MAGYEIGWYGMAWYGMVPLRGFVYATDRRRVTDLQRSVEAIV